MNGSTIKKKYIYTFIMYKIYVCVYTHYTAVYVHICIYIFIVVN